MLVSYPPAIILAAREQGVELPPFQTYDGYSPVLELAQELSPGADFGFLGGLKKAVSKVSHAATGIKAAGGRSSGVVNGNVVAFAIKTPLMPPKTALAAADRLLGDPKIGNAQAVVRNTAALASLGDPAAKRGLVVLNAAAKIRAQTKAQPGQAAVKNAKAPPSRTVTIKRTPAQVKRMAVKVANAPGKRPNVFKRIMIALGLSKGTVTA